MTMVSVDEAKATLSALIRRLAAGEEITITSSGEPVARLVPAQRTERVLGLGHGLFELPDDQHGTRSIGR